MRYRWLELDSTYLVEKIDTANCSKDCTFDMQIT